MKITGSCLCQTISFSFETDEKAFDSCHCGMCRKWSGGPAMAVNASRNLEIRGEENLATYKSSDWAQRGFCRKCGTHLFYQMPEKNFTNFFLGSLDQRDEMDFRCQIFTDHKPANYKFSNNTEMMTEEQVMEVMSK